MNATRKETVYQDDLSEEREIRADDGATGSNRKAPDVSANGHAATNGQAPTNGPQGHDRPSRRMIWKRPANPRRNQEAEDHEAVFTQQPPLETSEKCVEVDLISPVRARGSVPKSELFDAESREPVF